MKFQSHTVNGLLINEGDRLGSTLRAIPDRARVVLAQGFGVDNVGIPLRMLAYILPIVRLLGQLPQNVCAEFYLATEGVLRANHAKLNPEGVRERARAMAQLIHQYLVVLHPELAGRYRVLFDRQLDPSSPVEDLFRSLVDRSHGILEAEAAIAAFASHRGDGAVRYMVEHAVYMRDPINGLEKGEHPLVPEMVMDMDEVVMIGGPAEKVFYRFRKQLEGVVGTHSLWRSHQFFTKIGERPTYHVQNGEPLWADRAALPVAARDLFAGVSSSVTSEMGVNGNVIQDLMFLLADAGGLSNFALVSANYRRVRGGEPIDGALEDAMQQGWDRVRSLS